jgi:hypothetical protein
LIKQDEINKICRKQIGELEKKNSIKDPMNEFFCKLIGGAALLGLPQLKSAVSITILKNIHFFP